MGCGGWGWAWVGGDGVREGLPERAARGRAPAADKERKQEGAGRVGRVVPRCLCVCMCVCGGGGEEGSPGPPLCSCTRVRGHSGAHERQPLQQCQSSTRDAFGGSRPCQGSNRPERHTRSTPRSSREDLIPCNPRTCCSRNDSALPLLAREGRMSTSTPAGRSTAQHDTVGDGACSTA